MNFRYAGIGIALLGFALLFLFNRSKVELLNQGTFVCQKISATGYELQSVLKFNNPNLLSATILSVHETYSINNKEIAILHHDLQQGIPGRKESSIPVAVRFSTDDVIVEPGTKCLLTINGIIQYKSMFGEGEIPVVLSDSIIIQSI